jgi:hypothetical protein
MSEAVRRSREFDKPQPDARGEGYEALETPQHFSRTFSWASYTLGFSIGGFFDGILLPQPDCAGAPARGLSERVMEFDGA